MSSSLWRIRDCATNAGPQLADSDGLVAAILQNGQPYLHCWDVVFAYTESLRGSAVLSLVIESIIQH